MATFAGPNRPYRAQACGVLQDGKISFASGSNLQRTFLIAVNADFVAVDVLFRAPINGHPVRNGNVSMKPQREVYPSNK